MKEQESSYDARRPILNLLYLAKKICICYNAGRQKVMSLAVRSTKTPEDAASGVLYSVFAGWLRP